MNDLSGADGQDLPPPWGGSVAPTRRWDMKQKLYVLLFFAFGLVVLYLIFTNEGQELGEDFAAWIDDIILDR